MAGNQHSPSDYDPQTFFPDIFRLVTCIDSMLQHFDRELAEGNEQHDHIDSTRFLVGEVKRRLDFIDTVFAHVEINPKSPKNSAGEHNKETPND